MSEISQWINTILLIIILCYQWNKNKAFSHRIDQQTKLLNDTKIVVTQQATAVDSQAKVVETAIKYTESFDPEKIESILRKQIETESAEKLSELEKQYQKELSNKDQKYKEKLKEYITYSINEAITSSKTYIEQLLKMVIVLMVKISPKERNDFIAGISDGFIKEQLKIASREIDKEYKKVVCELLGDNIPQQ